MAMLTSVIICAYNEGVTVEAAIKDVCALPIEKEVLVVENGSTDNTRAILEDLAGRLPFKIVCNDRNIGKGHGVRLGLRQAKGQIITFHDADNELDAKDLIPLVELIIKGETDVAFGSRFLQDKKHAYFLNLQANLLISRMASLALKRKISDVETCYKVFRRELLDLDKLTSTGFDLDIEISFRLLMGKPKVRYRELPIVFKPRKYDEGKKIRVTDGIIALYRTIMYRLTL